MAIKINDIPPEGLHWGGRNSIYSTRNSIYGYSGLSMAIRSGNLHIS
jgi:hypothetical protein